MRRTISVAALAVLSAGLLAAGCGGPGDTEATTPATSPQAQTAGTASTAVSAQQAVSAAYRALRATTYVSSGTMRQKVDTSALDESIRDRVDEQLASTAANGSTTTRFESPERVAITQEMGTTSQQVVFYDGSVYVSADGETWAKATGQAAKAFSQASSVAQLDPAVLFTGLTGAGPADAGGAPATRYTGQVDVARAGEAVQSVIGGLGGLGAALDDSVSLESGTVEVRVDDATGMVARQDVTMTIRLDLGALAAAAGERDAASLGSVSITSTGTEAITDVGADVVVRQPAPTAVVSSVLQLGEFLAP